MTAAETLVRILDRLEEDGGSATFWWRDDDLEDPSDRLSDLLSATGDAGIEPAIAAISGTEGDRHCRFGEPELRHSAAWLASYEPCAAPGQEV